MQLRSHHTGNLAAAAALAMAVALATQTPAQTPPRPHVEVAAIRRNVTGADSGNVHIGSGRFDVQNMSIHRLIYVAYKVQANRIIGGPSWLDSDRYDITATGDDMNGDNFPLMLQTLLEDRFNLKVHREIKEGNVYELTIAKAGPKLQPTKPGTCVPLDLSKNRPQQDPNQRRCGSWQSIRSGTRIGAGITMTDTTGVGFQSLTGQLSSALDRPVIDKTGLTGLFDIHLEWTPDEVNAPTPADSGQPADTGPTIFTALREQLGLELKPTKGPVPFLVIDSVGRPSEN